MKRNLLCILSVFLGMINTTFAQWTSDPENPTIVCNEAGTQNNEQSIKDGAGGVYVFWIDSRAGSNQKDIYAQYYQADGIAQWELGGRKLVDYEGSVNSFSLQYNQNDSTILLAWTVIQSTVTADNGAFVRKMDKNGLAIWSQDLKVKNDSSYPSSISSIRLVKSQEKYYISTVGVVIGGANEVRINKIDGDGNLLWPFGGTVPTGMNSFGSFGCSSDENGGLYVYYSTSNGTGASLKCMLISGESNLQNQWLAWNDVTAGSAGLNYQYSGIGDPLGITFVFISDGNGGTLINLYANRIMAADGLNGWNGNTKTITGAAGNQSNFFWKKSGNNYYIVWGDGRPGLVGNYGIYAQKFTINGIILWEQDGLQVANLNTYIPYPKFDLDDNNTMCVTHQSGGMVAHKVTDNGTVIWGPAGCKVFSGQYSPSYQDYSVVYTGSRFVVAMINSSSNGADNVYINEVKLPPAQVVKHETACNSYALYDQTYSSTGAYTIDRTDTVITLNLTIVHNLALIEADTTSLTAVNDGDFQWYNCGLAQPIEGATGPVYTVTESGSYALILHNGECIDTSDCVELNILSLEKGQQRKPFALYPNPAKDQLFLQIEEPVNDKLGIRIFNTTGQLVYSSQISSSISRVEINTTGFASGLYVLQLEGSNGVLSPLLVQI